LKAAYQKWPVMLLRQGFAAHKWPATRSSACRAKGGGGGIWTPVRIGITLASTCVFCLLIFVKARAGRQALPQLAST